MFTQCPASLTEMGDGIGVDFSDYVPVSKF